MRHTIRYALYSALLLCVIISTPLYGMQYVSSFFSYFFDAKKTNNNITIENSTSALINELKKEEACSLTLVKQYIDQGADVNCKVDNKSLLEYAIATKRYCVVKKIAQETSAENKRLFCNYLDEYIKKSTEPKKFLYNLFLKWIVDALLLDKSEKYFSEARQKQDNSVYLYSAVKNNRNNLVQLLLSAGVDAHPNPNIIAQVTPLEAAIENNNKDLVLLLIEKTNLLSEDDIESSSRSFSLIEPQTKDYLAYRLLDCAWNKSKDIFEIVVTNIIKQELKKNSEERLKTSLPYTIFLLYDYLHTALKEKNQDKAQILVNILCVSKGYCNEYLSRKCLYVALDNGYRDLALQLLKKRAEHEGNNDLWRDVIHNFCIYSENKNNKANIEFLIDSKIDVNRANGGYTPLLYAAFKGNIELMQKLIEIGADDSVTCYDDINGNITAYGHAFLALLTELDNESLEGHIKFLLSKDKTCYDLWDSSSDFQAPVLCFLIEEEENDKVKILIDNGFDVNSKNKSGITPLHMAALKGNRDALEYLLKAKADINVKAENGVTPRDLALQEGHKEIAELLKSADQEDK